MRSPCTPTAPWARPGSSSCHDRAPRCEEEGHGARPRRGRDLLGRAHRHPRLAPAVLRTAARDADLPRRPDQPAHRRARVLRRRPGTAGDVVGDAPTRPAPVGPGRQLRARPAAGTRHQPTGLLRRRMLLRHPHGPAVGRDVHPRTLGGATRRAPAPRAALRGPRPVRDLRGTDALRAPSTVPRPGDAALPRQLRGAPLTHRDGARRRRPRIRAARPPRRDGVDLPGDRASGFLVIVALAWRRLAARPQPEA